MLVTKKITQQLECHDNIARLEVYSSERFLFTTRTAEKEDKNEMYPVTVKKLTMPRKPINTTQEYIKTTSNNVKKCHMLS